MPKVIFYYGFDKRANEIRRYKWDFWLGRRAELKDFIELLNKTSCLEWCKGTFWGYLIFRFSRKGIQLK